MPIHDWTRIDAGLFHNFHQNWITTLTNALNTGALPSDYYAWPSNLCGVRFRMSSRCGFPWMDRIRRRAAAGWPWRRFRLVPGSSGAMRQTFMCTRQTGSVCTIATATSSP